MAENKKSFTAYCDWNNTFNALPDEKAGQLIKHIFAYVNDENPVTDDLLINAVFANIRATLKRDLIKWNEKSEKNRASAQERWDKINNERNKKDANASEGIKGDAKDADSDSDSDSDSDKVNNNIESRKLAFAHTLKDFVPEFDRDLIKDFYDYWTETNEGGKKFRREMQKTFNTKMRLTKWKNNNHKFTSNGKSKITSSKEFKQIINAVQSDGVSR